ncbi:site-specific integrase [Sulfuricurvum sp.]|uniref:site-specific integrase n=1 Tax=Sulfuricurvum sp. TaxID=2025608 RepID=UPI002630A6EE|nr:site-specific integrase [Sulfuricurvum sp.]MDD3597920.1 site-specific integrase [Sulfuricurvum sp.]
MNEIDHLDVSAYRDFRLTCEPPRSKGKTLAASTVKLEMMLLSHIYTVAISEWGLKLDNPVAKVRKPKPAPGRTRRLSQKESTLILRKAHVYQNQELYPIIVIALETAMRQGEILSLRWENISWKKRVAHLPITKNGSARDVPLSNAALHVLKHYMHPKSEGKVFSYTQPGIKSTWRLFINSLGIEDLHFHDLRHEAISRLFEKGLDMLEVSTISGHKSLSMLKRYTHLLAYKLVPKLDPQKKRKSSSVCSIRDYIVAYPAIIKKRSKKCTIDFFDFVDLQVSGRNCDTVLSEAKEKLLKKIVLMLHNGETPPKPTKDISEIIEAKNEQISFVFPL